MSWAETKSAINSTVGTDKFKPLDKIVEDLILKTANTQAITIDKNGYYLPGEEYIGFSSVEVSVPPSVETPIGFTAFATGTFTPASDLTGGQKQDIEHGLGVVPNFFYIMPKDLKYIGDATYQFIYSQFFFIKTLYLYSGTSYSGGRFTIYTDGSTGMQLQKEYFNTSYVDDYVNETTFEISPSSNIRFSGGTEYFWICGVIDGLE